MVMSRWPTWNVPAAPSGGAVRVGLALGLGVPIARPVAEARFVGDPVVDCGVLAQAATSTRVARMAAMTPLARISREGRAADTTEAA
jgi:hypothetical protein